MKKVLALVLAALLVLAAGSAFAEGAGEGLYIGVVYKQSGNPYFQASVEGFEKAAAELGFEFDHDGPDDSSNDGQIRIIENYITAGADAIIVSANDPAGLVNVLQEAMDAGIAVVSYDAPVAPEGRMGDVEPASFRQVGAILVESIAKSIGYEGQVAILSASATMGNQQYWCANMEDIFATDEAYANIEYVGTVYGDDVYDKSFTECQALLNQYPDLKGIIVPTTNGAPAVAKCIQEQGKDVKVTGLTLASDMKEYLEAGICDETFLWNPIDLAYVASYLAVALVNGDVTGAVGETIAAGEKGDLPIIDGDDGGATLYLGELNTFNLDTVDAWVDIL